MLGRADYPSATSELLRARSGVCAPVRDVPPARRTARPGKASPPPRGTNRGSSEGARTSLPLHLEFAASGPGAQLPLNYPGSRPDYPPITRELPESYPALGGPARKCKITNRREGPAGVLHSWGEAPEGAELGAVLWTLTTSLLQSGGFGGSRRFDRPVTRLQARSRAEHTAVSGTTQRPRGPRSERSGHALAMIVARPDLSRLRGRGRGAARRPVADRAGDHPRDGRAPRTAGGRRWSARRS